MDDKTLTQNRLCAEALRAEQGSRTRDAAALFRKAISCDPSNPTPYLFFGHALQLLGEQEAATQVWSIGADLDPRFIGAWRNAEVDENVRLRSKCADEAVRAHFTRLHQSCIADYQKANPHANIDRIAAAIWCQTHDSEFEYQHPRQRPHLFYIPGLPPRPVYSAADLEWVDELESSWLTIRDEFLAVEGRAADQQKPYLEAGAAALGSDWKPLAASLAWGSYHLFKKGVPNNRLIELFPKTLKALENVPLIRNASGHPSEVFFSVLQGERDIPAHYGLANTDIAVHLPLLGTPESAIRVADTVYEWKEGKVFAFDDAFDHESWNRSPEVRVNLLFEAWNPDLSIDERNAITATFEARQQWASKRSLDYSPLTSSRVRKHL